MASDTNDRLKLLDQIDPGDARFTAVLLNEVHSFGRRFQADADERWSLIDCGLTDDHWLKVLAWARACGASEVPHHGSRAAGLLLLLVGAAVARSLERDEPLWHMVAASCSESLRRNWFNSVNDYPSIEIREAIDDACNALALRNQLDLQGKHRYWRTIQLQFGFSGKVGAARLPYWLTGHSVPDTIKALLSEDDLNRSRDFRALWSSLSRWNRDASNPETERNLLSNPWYPSEAHKLITEGLRAGRDSCITANLRSENEEAVSSIFGVPRFRSGSFQVGLASVLPPEVVNNPAPVLTLYAEGIGMVGLVRDEHGVRQLEGGHLSTPVEEVLDSVTREISISSRSGVIYKQRFSFWAEDADLVFFRGNAGRMVTNPEKFVPEPGCPYVIVTASAIDLLTDNLVPLECEVRSRDWKLYNFPSGLPAALEARVEGALLWSPQQTVTPPVVTGFSLNVREKTPTTLEVNATAPDGWGIDKVRFAGQMLAGNHAIVEVSPASDYLKRRAQVYASRDGRRTAFNVEPQKVGIQAIGAAVEREDGSWLDLGRDLLDAGTVEGCRVAIHWDSSDDDPWLTLGSVPVVRDPRIVCRQHLRALGEPLELRFGLMNELTAQRVPLVRSVFSTGILESVRTTTDLYQLKLRQAIEAAADLRVWVWEDHHSEPRLLARPEVEADPDNRTLNVLRLSAGTPLGWALSLDREWQGGRFQFNPGTAEWPRLCMRWASTLADSNDWPATACALRWWQFPVLMNPFCSVVHEQVRKDPLRTMLAWIASEACSEMRFSPSEAEGFGNAFRSFLWEYAPSTADCQTIWSKNSEEVLIAMEAGRLALPVVLLLYSHPVLLARIICEVLASNLVEEESTVPVIMDRNLFRRVPDPTQIRAIEEKYLSFSRVVADFVERSAGIFRPNAAPRDALLREAVWELRSWQDRSPLDQAYFQEYIVRPAEALFDQQPADTKRLEVAVSRSPACCAYLVSHLLATKGMRSSKS